MQGIQGKKLRQWGDGTPRYGSTLNDGLVAAHEKCDEWETYGDQDTKNGKSKERKVNNKNMSAKESEEIVEGVCWLGHDAKYGDEDCTRGNEESANKHIVRKDVSKQQTGEKCIPQEGDGAKRC